MSPKRKKKAISYLRFSTKSQGKEGRDSKRRQLAMASEWCARNKIELETSLSFQDLGVSAYKGANAEHGKLKALLDEARKPNGRIQPGDYLLVEHIDRISRLPPLDAFALIKQLLDAGLVIITLQDGAEFSEYTLNNEDHKMFQLLGAINNAHNHSKNLSRRLKATMDQRRKDMKAGIKRKHRCPEWVRWDKLTRDYVLVPELASIVADIWTIRASSPMLGITQIARRFEEEKRKCPTSKGWYAHIAHILASKEVCGTRTIYSGEDGYLVPVDKVENYYPAVVSSDIYAKAREYQTASSFYNRGRCRRGYDSSVTNLFTRISFCSLCGTVLVLDHARYLYCKAHRTKRTCPGVSIRRLDMEQRFLQFCSSEISASELLSDKSASAELTAALKTVENTKALVLEKEQSQNQLIKNLTKPGIPEALANKILEEASSIEQEIEALKAKSQAAMETARKLQHNLDNTDKSLTDIKQLADSDHPEGRAKLRAAIASLVERVELNTDHSLTVLFRTGVERRIINSMYKMHAPGTLKRLDKPEARAFDVKPERKKSLKDIPQPTEYDDDGKESAYSVALRTGKVAKLEKEVAKAKSRKKS